MTRIILVRHGQTEWNRVERFRGHADVPLNETGLAQAETTGKRIAAEWMPVAVYSSPLVRAVRTGEAIVGHYNLLVQIHPDLIDIDYGRWQGLTPDEVREQWPEMIDDWYNKPASVQIPGGETLEHLRSRARAVIDELTARHTNQAIVVVGHTVINRIILLSVLGLSNDCFWRLRQDTCAINCFETDRGEFTLVSLNDTCHLRSSIQHL
jgi:broad specificity phosphatase PhoE